MRKITAEGKGNLKEIVATNVSNSKYKEKLNRLKNYEENYSKKLNSLIYRQNRFYHNIELINNYIETLKELPTTLLDEIEEQITEQSKKGNGFPFQLRIKNELFKKEIENQNLILSLRELGILKAFSGGIGLGTKDAPFNYQLLNYQNVYCHQSYNSSEEREHNIIERKIASSLLRSIIIESLRGKKLRKLLNFAKDNGLVIGLEFWT